MRVFTATCYDKCTKDMSYETYIVQGVDDDVMTEPQILKEILKPYGITDDDVHMFFEDGELDDRVFKDTEEFFYLIGDEVIADGKD